MLDHNEWQEIGCPGQVFHIVLHHIIAEHMKITQLIVYQEVLVAEVEDFWSRPVQSYNSAAEHRFFL